MNFPSKTSLVIWSLLLWGVWSAADYYGETEYLTRSRNAYYRVTVNLDYQDKPVELKAVVKCRISNMRELGGALRSGFGAAPEVVGKRLDDGSGLFILPSESKLCDRVYSKDGLTFDESYETIIFEGTPRTYWVKDFLAQNYAEVYFSKSSYTDPEAKFKNAKLAISTATREDYQTFRKQKDVIIRDQDEKPAIPFKNLYCFFALNIHDEALFEQNSQLKSLLQTETNEQDKTIGITPNDELLRFASKFWGQNNGYGPRIETAIGGRGSSIRGSNDPDMQNLIDHSLLAFRPTIKNTLEPYPTSKIISCVSIKSVQKRELSFNFSGLSRYSSDIRTQFYVNLKEQTLTIFFDFGL